MPKIDERLFASNPNVTSKYSIEGCCPLNALLAVGWINNKDKLKETYVGDPLI